MKVVIQRFEVGPILGAVSPTTARLWGRGSEHWSNGSLRRSFGAARLQRGGPVHATDNFSRVAVNLDRIRVEFFARKGQRLGNAKNHNF